ncbi:MAG: ABC transporter permease [Pseudonocardiaceae bacterium]
MTRSQRVGRRDVRVMVAVVMTVAFVLAGTLVPLGMVLRTAFSAEALPHYAGFLTSRAGLTTLRNTVVLGLLVGLCGTALGFLFAYVQARLDVPFKRALHVIALIPIVSPPFAVATAIIVLYGRKGLITYGVLGLSDQIYGLDGLVLVLSLSFFPVAYLGLLSMMRALDPALEEAAMNLGASCWRIFRTVQLPLLAPGLAAPFLLLFVESIADLANPLVLGGDYTVLASSAYFAVTGEYDTTSAAVYSVILLVPTVGLFVAQRYWLGGKVRTTVTGRPSGSVHLVGGWARWPIFALALLVGAVILSLYATVILGGITTNVFGANYELTLGHFHEVLLGHGRESITNTLLLAVIATPIAGLMGTIIAWLVVRHVRAAALWLDFVGMLGIAVPGTVLGIGYLLAYHTKVAIGPVTVLPAFAGVGAVFGGALAIVLSYVARSLPGGQRTAMGALSQLHPSLEEASANLGTDHGTTLRRITLPLIRPALLTGLCYSFTHSMTSVSAVVFLVTSDTPIMTSQILNAVNTSHYGVAFAYCTVLTVIVLLSFGLIRLTVGRSVALNRVDVSATRGG